MRSDSGAGLGPAAPAVATDDALRDRQAHARALELVAAVHALEGAEEPLGVSHVEAGAVVPNEVDPLALMAPPTHLDGWALPLARELEGVGHQVDEHLLEQRPVAHAIRQIPHRDHDPSLVPLLA